ncbi:MAG: dihydrofolate reductase [Bacteroidetes bacterium]|nr:MAG: dihydrofolate reductase [Bacteroidota bacterium]
MKKFLILTITIMSISIYSCDQADKGQSANEESDFMFLTEQFADVKIMRYQIPGFEELSLEQKKLIYYLGEAALAGRDIIFDQNFKYNLAVRRTMEEILKNYDGDRQGEEFQEFVTYLKRVWFSSGIHHHYANDKFVPGFSREYFETLVNNSSGSIFPMKEGQDLDTFIDWMSEILFNKAVAAKRISSDISSDLILASACNYYEGVSQEEAEAYYAAMKVEGDKTPISYGLNAKLVKKDGVVMEEVYKVGGLYGDALLKVIYWLDKAATVAETEKQKEALLVLVEYYKTGDLELWDDYNVLWVEELQPRVDYVNGFIEVYGDPMGMKASWESVVNFKDLEATKRTVVISSNAQWFEDNSPTDDRFKKEEVKGVSAKVITVAQLGGDCHPSTPIGINLPNADWIRKDHGSKSVTMDNITYAYDQASLGNGFLEEFCATLEEIEREKKYGYVSGNIHTDMHECLGHGSGQLLPGTSPEALKNYSSVLEESRADLFALYYMWSPKMQELGLLPSKEAAMAAYDGYLRNGLMTQLTRIQAGKDIEQAHMRNRQLISRWCYEHGLEDNVIEKLDIEGKSYFKINDYDKLNFLMGELLAEVQRIKSEGDYEAGKALVENYAVKVDPNLHAEVLLRFEKLNLSPYGGFLNPLLVPVFDGEEIVDIKVEYPDDFAAQMMRYAKDYSYLPTYN